MKSRFKIFLFLATIFISESATAQHKTIVMVNKKNHLKAIFNLPCLANLNLIDDLPDFKNKVIIDSVNTDILFVSNPANRAQQLTIPIANIVYMHIPNYPLVDVIRILVGAYSALGAAIFFLDIPSNNALDEFMLISLLSGTSYTLLFIDNDRTYSTQDYYIKNTYK